MTTDVLRLQGNYLVQTPQGGVITLDVGTSGSTGTVIINGNLDVKGATTQIESINATIKDTTVILNSGEPATGYPNGHVTNGTSGLMIARGSTGNLDDPTKAAFIEWNDAATWRGSGSTTDVQGLFEFRIGPTNGGSNTRYSAIKVNAIRIDENSAAVISGIPRLNILGHENQGSLISVSGCLDYYSNLINNGDPDDIPTKQYVDYMVSNAGGGLVVGKSYLTIIDNSIDSQPSEIIGVIDGHPSDKLSISSGTVVMRIGAAGAQFTGINLSGNQVLSVGSNSNLQLSANGSGQIFVNSPMLLAGSSPAVPSSGQTGIYTTAPSGGGTGVFYVNNTTGSVVQDEFISRRKALIFSIIF